MRAQVTQDKTDGIDSRANRAVGDANAPRPPLLNHRLNHTKDPILASREHRTGGDDSMLVRLKWCVTASLQSKSHSRGWRCGRSEVIALLLEDVAHTVDMSAVEVVHIVENVTRSLDPYPFGNRRQHALPGILRNDPTPPASNSLPSS